ncbi:DUF1570 domain-containing protein [Mucilaginibacter paludis]|uniref:DUF1570 domain-containing protein n=1 Tax=Mucilaginibacter paludis DSM 18603 TaxID=714943 RepID=H1Y5Y8_9SPHI|nr:DUF1570 domain-containing protein [Mucilaginibacter paludis]EHQ30410.1 hypothetical protein Mucpa_6356 [Mucilaginibacter paludis DSM 18603]
MSTLNLNPNPLNVFCLIFIIAFILGGQPLWAQNFDVNTIHCSMSDDNRATMNKIGKFEGHFYNVIFNTSMNDTVTVKINLYGRKSEYKQVQNENIHTTFIDGFYSGENKQIYLYKTENYMNILLHETSHAILYRNLNNAPKWLNEGIATLFGRMVISNKDEVFYVKQTHYIKLLKGRISDRTFSLEDFFNYKNEDWFNAEKREYLYTVAYCLIYFLAEDNIDNLQRLMILLKEGNSSYAAINKIYGSQSKFEGRFFDFYSKQSAYSSD